MPHPLDSDNNRAVAIRVLKWSGCRRGVTLLKAAA